MAKHKPIRALSVETLEARLNMSMFGSLMASTVGKIQQRAVADAAALQTSSRIALPQNAFANDLAGASSSADTSTTDLPTNNFQPRDNKYILRDRPQRTFSTADRVRPVSSTQPIKSTPPKIETSTFIKMEGSQLSLTPSKPFELLSGTVNVKLTMTAPAAHVEQVSLWSIDGQSLVTRWEKNPTVSIDTTNLRNGVHTLRVVTAIRLPNGEWTAVGQVTTTINTNNQTSFSKLQNKYSELFMKTGETINLGTQAIATDGTIFPELPAKPTYTSSNTNVAIVDADGNVTKVGTGVATITTKLAQKVTTTVVDDRKDYFTHLYKDGTIATTYDPERSQLSLSLMNATGFGMSISQLKSLGFNTIEMGFMQNMADNGSFTDDAESLERWKRGLDGLLDPVYKQIVDNDMSIMATGDDMLRFLKEAQWTFNNPVTGTATVKYALEKLANTGRALGVAIVDERPMFDEKMLTTMGMNSWEDLRKAVAEIFDSVPDAPNGYWSIGAPLTLSSINEWNANDDLLSVYVTPMTSPPGTRDLNMRTMNEVAGYVTWQLDQIRTGIADRPIIGLGSAIGQFDERKLYYSENQAFVYTMTWAIRGASSIRTYREGAAMPDDTLAGLSRANHLIQENQAYLLQPVISAPDLGKGILTTARQGVNGTMVMALNTLETPMQTRVDLSTWSGVPNDIKDVTIAPGQAVVWKWPA